MSDVDRQPETSDLILEAALHAIGRRGVKKLGMQDVSESAGVSRSTLYRYFPNKEDLLAALVRYEQKRFEASLRRSIEHCEGDDKILATVDHAFAYLQDHPTLDRVLEVEPAFVLRYLREHVPAMRRATALLLQEVLEQSAPVRAGVVTVEQLADLLVHVLVGSFLTPGEHPEEDAQAVKGLFGMLGGGPPNHVAPAGRNRQR